MASAGIWVKNSAEGIIYKSSWERAIVKTVYKPSSICSKVI